MTSPTYATSDCRGSHSYYSRFLLDSFLGVVVAFPLGIITASIEAVTLFGEILPISILFGLIFPIVVPLITLYCVFLASSHLGKTIAASVQKFAARSHVIHILSHAHEIAYMSIYGVVAIFSTKPLEPEVADSSSFSLILRRTRTRLFIDDFPEIIPVFPPTPPYSDGSCTPSRPPYTESTDASLLLRTPANELSHTPLAPLLELLATLKGEELSIVAAYVESLKRG